MKSERGSNGQNATLCVTPPSHQSQDFFFLFFESTAATRALLKEGSKGRFVQELTAELHPLVEWTHYKRNRWLSLSSQSAARYLADFS